MSRQQDSGAPITLNEGWGRQQPVDANEVYSEWVTLTQEPWIRVDDEKGSIEGRRLG